MLWRCRRSLLRLKPRNIILNALRFSSTHYLSSLTVGKSLEFSWESAEPEEGFLSKPKLELTSDIVHSTLKRCPSDLIALNFFLWCAKQNNYFHDAQAFDYMVGVAEKLTVRYKTVKGLVGKLESVGCVVKPQIFLLLLRIYWRGGMFDMVLEAYEEMSNFGYVPNTFARNVIMDVLFKIGRGDVAIEVLKETQVPNFLSFNIALCNLCKINDLINLKDIIKIMLRKGFYPNSNTFEMILNGFCKMGRLSEASQILGFMICLGNSVCVNAWSMLINGFFQLGEPWRACALLNKMLEIGCSPNVVTYTTLIKGFMESKMVSNAFGILNSMKSKGLAPDLVLCNVLIDVLTKMGRFDDALDVFVGLSERKLVPDTYTFSSIVSNVCLSRRFSLLTNIANGIALEADLVVCNSLLNYFCKAGYPSFAVKLYSDMIDRGFAPDNYSFVGLLCALCEEGRISEAVDVYNGMVVNYPGLDAHVHTAIINGLIKSDKYHKAIHLFRRSILEKYALDVVSYTVAIQGFVQAGRIEEAHFLINQMKEIGISPNAQTYRVVISGFCKEKDTGKVKELLEEIGKGRIELDSNTLIRVHKVLSRSSQLSYTNQFSKMLTSKLVSDEAISAPLFDVSDSGVKVDKDDLLMEKDLLMDSYSSDDFPHVAASVC